MWDGIQSYWEIKLEMLKLSVQERFLSHLWEGRGSDSYPIISQPKDIRRVVKQQQQLKSQLILVNFYFVLAQFQIKIARFSMVFTTYVQFCTHIVVLYFLEPFQQPNFFISPQKFVPHAQLQPFHCFPSHQQLIDLNDQQKLQYLPNKVSIFE